MTRRLLRRHGRERFSRPLGVDDEPKGIHLRVDLTERGERPRAAAQKRDAVRVPDETELGDAERERRIAVLLQPISGALEGVLTSLAEFVKGERPFGAREGLHAFAVRLPVSGVLGVEPLHECVTRDEIGQDGLGCVVQ
jgi:hypothetical protein